MTDRETNGFLRLRIRPPVWKTAIGILAAYLVASGFDWKTPRQKFAAIDARIDTTNQAVVSNRTRLDQIDQNFLIVFKLSCLDRRYTSRDMQLVGLNCPAILSPAPAIQAGEPRRTP